MRYELAAKVMFWVYGNLDTYWCKKKRRGSDCPTGIAGVRLARYENEQGEACYKVVCHGHTVVRAEPSGSGLISNCGWNTQKTCTAIRFAGVYACITDGIVHLSIGGVWYGLGGPLVISKGGMVTGENLQALVTTKRVKKYRHSVEDRKVMRDRVDERIDGFWPAMSDLLQVRLAGMPPTALLTWSEYHDLLGTLECTRVIERGIGHCVSDMDRSPERLCKRTTWRKAALRVVDVDSAYSVVVTSPAFPEVA